MMAKVALECGDISASQEDILARSSFLGGDNHVLEEEEPPLTQQDPITICTLPFTPSQSPAPPDDHDDQDDDQAQDDTHIKPRRKPRVCTRKVRGARSARIRMPSPSPSPKQQQPPPQHQQDVDPLYRAVLMIPAAAATTTTTRLNHVEDFLALARHRGLF